MKRIIFTMLMAIMTVMGAMAQADKIVGIYKAVQEGNESKVKIFKHDGGYRAQIIWLKNPKNADGTVKYDRRNPDKAKRNVPSDRIVVIDKVVYRDGIWQDGKVYDPTKGKVFNVELKFNDAKTLEVKGKLGPFFKRVYWTKIQ